MALNKLTAMKVARAKKPGYYGDGGGLWLRVGPTGAKSWIFRFKVDKRQREMGLGGVNAFTLIEARERARLARQLRADDLDPINERRNRRHKAKLEAAKAMTFKECAQAYVAAHQAGWRNARHALQWPTTLRAYVYPVIGELPVQNIDTALVMKVLNPIWAQKTETASRVRGRIESILEWATTSGYRAGDNPARWRGHLENLLPKKNKVRAVEHLAALPYAELAAFMSELRQQQGVAARALEFAVLTATRTGEVLGAQWDELPPGASQWVIPAKRTKAGKARRVPLSDAALAVIEKMQEIRDGKFVFPGAREKRPLNATAMAATLKRMGRGEVVVHGFRSSFRDWSAESTNFPREVAEMALGHTIGDATENAYRRTDMFEKRRQLMDAWARYCETPVVPDAENIVPIRVTG